MAWDAEDSHGVTAGEFALDRGHQRVWTALVDAGVAHVLKHRGPQQSRSDWNAAYLEQPLAYNNDNLLDASGNPVMMPWEGQIMAAHATEMRGDVLNVGFGIGLIDGLLQAQMPKSHHIIEAHPDVQRHILSKGWREKPGVTVHFGRWQDAMSEIPTDSLDAVFFDTHDEGVEDMLQWAREAKRVLRPTGLLSFWNAYNAHNIFLHAVHCKAVTLSLAEMGFHTEWRRMAVEMPQGTWNAWNSVQNWYLDSYRLPLCRFSDPNKPRSDTALQQAEIVAADMSDAMRQGIASCAARALRSGVAVASERR